MIFMKYLFMIILLAFTIGCIQQAYPSYYSNVNVRENEIIMDIENQNTVFQTYAPVQALFVDFNEAKKFEIFFNGLSYDSQKDDANWTLQVLLDINLTKERLRFKINASKGVHYLNMTLGADYINETKELDTIHFDSRILKVNTEDVK